MRYIVLFMLAVLLSMYANAGEKITCKGTTKSGKHCKSAIVSKETYYCNAHNPKRVHCIGKTVKGKPCGMIVLKGSNHCRLHG